MNHLSHEELQEHAGGRLPDERAALAQAHLRACAECTRRLGSLRTLERALRSLPLERAPQGLSANVLRSLGIRESQSWLYTLSMNFAPLVALLLVLTVVYLVLGKPVMGAQSQTAAGESAGSLLQLADRYSAVGVQSVNAWVGTYFAFAKTSAGVTGFLLLFLALIGLLDKYLFMPLLRRRLSVRD